jgi:hypothetical protein
MQNAGFNSVQTIYICTVWIKNNTSIYIMTCIPIASQRLGKHIPAKRMRATEEYPLLSNGPLDTPP